MIRMMNQQGFASAKYEEDLGPEWMFTDAASPSMQAVEGVIRELAHSTIPVLLIGERGTGKRTIARRIHQNAGGLNGQFRTTTCRDISLEDLTFEGFGSGGTVYFDEIGELGPECQKRLLEMLSAHSSNGSGNNQARVICGSSRDLESQVRGAVFREDLYYRLSGVCLRIPPLRQRKEDVSHLTSFFLKWYAEAFHRPVPVLSTATQQLFLDYAWPGNLSELAAAARAIVAVGDESVVMGGLRSMLTGSDQRSAERLSLKETARAASRQAEKELILKVLTRTRWNRRRAAQELQISYKALLYKLKQIGYGEFEAS
ncbi:MAG TPA: sigma 54-interacting transcriptional regulator [Terriglobales bacterium]|nr:sigma 54-interacting transcriptional regulator [Terriglobales bacterium]